MQLPEYRQRQARSFYSHLRESTNPVFFSWQDANNPMPQIGGELCLGVAKTDIFHSVGTPSRRTSTTMKRTIIFLCLAMTGGGAYAQSVDPYGNIIIGNGATISPPLDPASPNTVSTGQIVIGTGAHTDGQDAIAHGTGASATKLEAMARGKNAKATALYSDADGSEAEATANNSIAKGHKAKSTGVGAVAFGAESKATADRCVAMGVQSECDEANTVSVGRENDERRITNVQNGRDDTDVVNVRQIRPMAQSLGGGATYNIYGQFVPPTYNFQSGAVYNDVGSALYDLDGRVTNLELTPGGDGTGPAGPAGADGVAGANGASAYEVATSNGFNGTEQQWLDSLKGADGQDGAGNGSTTVQAGKNIEVEDSADGKQTVSVSDNVELTDQGSLKVGTTTVNNTGVSIEGGPSMTREGIDAGNRRITSVAPGRIEQGSTDAVNGGQLWDLENRFDDRWQEVDKRLNGLGAQMGAMSMMAATPGEGGMTVGVGYSGGQTAMAMGWSRRVSQRASISFGASFGGGNKPVVGMGLRIGGR